MATQAENRRPIGRILLDGGFLSQGDLGLALEEQKRTNELLGRVLVRMGVLDPADIDAVLAVQERLTRPEDAVKMAAGVRQMLGVLLLQSGRITNEELDHAIAEQKRSGERLGAILVRRGHLTEQQLFRLLDFQRNQGVDAPGPLRLGELLVGAGRITREQLDAALRKQAGSGKKLGEVLIEEGYAQPGHIRHGMRLQQMLQTSVLAALLSIGGLTACGGAQGTATDNSEQVATTAASSDRTQGYANSWIVTEDEYGLRKPNYYYSTSNDAFWSIQADIGVNVWDPDFRTIMRIDIPRPTDGSLPNIGGRSYAIEDNGLYEKFPGSFLVLNGEKSALKKVERGAITFSSAATLNGAVSGTFDVILVDYDSATTDAPQYRLKGSFDFMMGTYGPASL
jgi:hypothetical protein